MRLKNSLKQSSVLARFGVAVSLLAASLEQTKRTRVTGRHLICIKSWPPASEKPRDSPPKATGLASGVGCHSAGVLGPSCDPCGRRDCLTAAATRDIVVYNGNRRNLHNVNFNLKFGHSTVARVVGEAGPHLSYNVLMRYIKCSAAWTQVQTTLE